MPRDYSNKNLQKAIFKNEDLSNARFIDSDLRGADFNGADLTGADFTRVKTGITPVNKTIIFFSALIISLLSGYVAMLAGHTIQVMLASTDNKIRIAGIFTTVLILLFIGFSLWKGVGRAIRQLVVPVIVVAFVIGIIAYVSGLGTGKGMLYLILSLLLVVVMFIVGTIARATAGTLSSTILFIIVAMGGATFGKSVGGGIGTVIMALSCVQISKRALSGAAGFESLRKVAHFITTRYGTSFQNARLREALFSRSVLHNADFSNADVSLVDWGDSKTQNCFLGDNLFNIKTQRHG